MIRLTIGNIDRTLYTVLRESLVQNNLLPNISNYQGPTGPQDYKDAKITLGENLVEVFGVGSDYSKGEALLNRITISRKSIDPGSIGGFPEIEYVKKGNGNFEKYKIPVSSKNINYEIRTICKRTNIDRILSTLVQSSIPSRGYLKIKETIPTGGTPTPEPTIKDEITFFVEYTGMSTIRDMGDVIERMYTFTVVDAWIESATLIDPDYPALTSIEYFLNTESLIVPSPIGSNPGGGGSVLVWQTIEW